MEEFADEAQQLRKHVRFLRIIIICRVLFVHINLIPYYVLFLQIKNPTVPLPPPTSRLPPPDTYAEMANKNLPTVTGGRLASPCYQSAPPPPPPPLPPPLLLSGLF